MRLTLHGNPCARLASACLCVLLASLVSAQTKQPKGKDSAEPPTQESRPAISVEARPQLFAVLCALDAAGFDSDVSTTNEAPGRVQLRKRMQALQGPAVEALRKYYREHALADSGAVSSRFVSFALAVGPPPKFVGSSRVDLQACKLEYSIVSPK